jgi:hypothetical protein
MNNYPKTKEEWWEFIDLYKDQLLNTIKQSEYDQPQKFRIIDKDGAKICAEWDDPKNRDTVTLVGQFLHGVDTKNFEAVYEVLNTVWAKAPDTFHIHYRPAWGVLCDLLSEGPSLFSEEESG